MDMLIDSLPIEYYGVENSDYPTPTVIEKIIYLPDIINPKSILRVYSSLDLIFNNSSSCFNNIYFCICNVTFNIEYIDSVKDDTINIFCDNIYSPLNFHINSGFSLNNLNPKISYVHLKLLDMHKIYIYFAISPA